MFVREITKQPTVETRLQVGEIKVEGSVPVLRRGGVRWETLLFPGLEWPGVIHDAHYILRMTSAPTIAGKGEVAFFRRAREKKTPSKTDKFARHLQTWTFYNHSKRDTIIVNLIPLTAVDCTYGVPVHMLHPIRGYIHSWIEVLHPWMT